MTATRSNLFSKRPYVFALTFLLVACSADHDLVRPPGDPEVDDGVTEGGDDPFPPEIIVDPDHPQPPTPATVATGQTFPSSIQVFEDSVYWIDRTDGAQIRWLHLDGGGWEKVTELTSEPFDVAVDDAGLYLTLPGIQSVWFSAHNELSARDLHASPGDALAIALDENFVYWTTEAGCVFRGDKSGGDPEEVNCAEGIPVALAVNENGVYWGTVDGVLYGASTTPGGVVDKLADGESFDAGLLADQTYLFWANEDARDIRRLKRSGGLPQVVEAGQFSVASMNQDRFFLYFSSLADGSIRKVPKQGGLLRVMSTGHADPTDIAVSSEVIFWTNEADGTISRLLNFY